MSGQVPESMEQPKSEGIAWVEARIRDKLRSGTTSFQALAEMVPVKRRSLRSALARLTKAGTIVAVMDVAKDKEGRAIPVYDLAVADGSDSKAQIGEVRPTPTAAPKGPAKTKVPRRKDRGFRPGGWNDRMSQAIVNSLQEYGPLSVDDLHMLLGLKRCWMARSLDRLQEVGAIVMEPDVIRDKDGQWRDIVKVFLVAPELACRVLRLGDRDVEAGSTMIRPEVEDAGDCPACEQVGVGRGACSACSRSCRSR